MDITTSKFYRDKCFINGEWVGADSGETISVNNPATLKEIGTVPKCGTNEACLLYTSPSPRDMRRSRMPSSA